jgi:hypothetical protein
VSAIDRLNELAARLVQVKAHRPGGRAAIAPAPERPAFRVAEWARRSGPRQTELTATSYFLASGTMDTVLLAREDWSRTRITITCNISLSAGDCYAWPSSYQTGTPNTFYLGVGIYVARLDIARDEHGPLCCAEWRGWSHNGGGDFAANVLEWREV